MHLSHNSIAAPSSFLVLALAMQSSHGTFAPARLPRGLPVLVLLADDSLIA